jgi:hypothetical protein
MHSRIKIAGSCLLGMAVGFVLIVLPGLSNGYPGSLLILVNDSVEGLGIEHFLLLFAGGFFLGVALQSPYCFYSSACILGSLPLFAFVEMAKDPTSHNLWPIEFFLYAVFSLIPIAGTGFAWRMKWQVSERAS